MQYLLTETEYREIKDHMNYEKIIQKLCVQVAENKPVLFWSNEIAEIWGCHIHGVDNNYGYCDKCPVQDVCPEKRKKWSK